MTVEKVVLLLERFRPSIDDCKEALLRLERKQSTRENTCGLYY